MDPLKALYSDPNQLKALYADATASRTQAWNGGEGLTPKLPASARTQNPHSARYERTESLPASARVPAPRQLHTAFYQQPVTARAAVSTAGPAWLETKPLKDRKDPRQPPSARPAVTPRQAAQSANKPESAAPAPASGAPYIPPAGTSFEYEGGSSVVLSPHTDPPTEKEVIDYAKWLGLDPDTEPELLWLAREALTAPLPPYWRPCNTQDGEVYYFNFSTGESLWDHPMDSLFKKSVPLEKERLQAAKEKGTPYDASQTYINATIGAFLAHLCPADLQESILADPEPSAATTAPAEAAPFIPKSGTVFEYEGGGYSAVLEDNADRYTPTENEIADYAQWLGISKDSEGELLWIAKDGLTTPLPEPWRPCKTNTGDLYYFNFGTGESSWEHPMDEFFKRLVSLERERLAQCKRDGTPYTRSSAKP
eukprot:TRINITY_DN5096_c0_g1_i1.p1 TRINITY_DN5096_c0_g1~~TRINITY_DN5096_c0_g1_i1.p1  ORF type:complete len:425 (+),score=53.24 TRINITY_DN5096_c0_g1_i1:61-1335(+)